MVTAEHLKQFHIDPSLADSFNETFQRFDISSPIQQASWIGQCGHECGNFRIMEENLNYRAATLLKLFPKTPKRQWGFTPEEAAAYEKQPQRIANRIYGNRMGNRDEASGDGWKYRGRGYLQTTGKSNYSLFDATVPDNLVITPDLVATKYPLTSAGFFFTRNKIWEICDGGESEEIIKAVTKKVNGGYNGLDDRIKKFKLYQSLL